MNEMTRVKRRTDILSSDIDGETGMLDVNNAKYFSLDSVGTDIWETIAEAKAVGEIVDAMMKMYDVEREQCMKDILSLLGQMKDKELIDIL